jgi:hypothetical protein
MSDFVTGSGLPAPDPDAPLRWVRPRWEQTIRVWCLSERPVWAMIHWWRGQSVACVGDICPPWLHECPCRRRLYLLVAYTPPLPPWGLEVGPRAGDGIQQQLAGGLGLRGKRIDVRKAGPAQNSPTELDWGPPHRDRTTWSDPLDLGQYLIHTWTAVIDAELARLADAAAPASVVPLRSAGGSGRGA